MERARALSHTLCALDAHINLAGLTVRIFGAGLNTRDVCVRFYFARTHRERARSILAPARIKHRIDF